MGNGGSWQAAAFVALGLLLVPSGAPAEGTSPPDTSSRGVYEGIVVAVYKAPASRIPLPPGFHLVSCGGGQPEASYQATGDVLVAFDEIAFPDLPQVPGPVRTLQLVTCADSSFSRPDARDEPPIYIVRRWTDSPAYAEFLSAHGIPVEDAQIEVSWGEGTATARATDRAGVTLAAGSFSTTRVEVPSPPPGFPKCRADALEAARVVSVHPSSGTVAALDWEKLDAECLSLGSLSWDPTSPVGAILGSGAVPYASLREFNEGARFRWHVLREGGDRAGAQAPPRCRARRWLSVRLPRGRGGRLRVLGARVNGRRARVVRAGPSRVRVRVDRVRGARTRVLVRAVTTTGRHIRVRRSFSHCRRLPAAGPDGGAPRTTEVGANGNVFTGGLGFERKEVTVGVGDAVRWRNTDSVVPHTASEEHGLWDLGGSYGQTPASPAGFGPGQTVERRFEAGTHTYLCRVHPRQMRGTVAVAPSLALERRRVVVGWAVSPPEAGLVFDAERRRAGSDWTPLRSGTTESGASFRAGKAGTVWELRARLRRAGTTETATGWSPVASVTIPRP